MSCSKITFLHYPFKITSAAFSLTIIIGAWINTPGILGKTLASTTLKFCTPRTLNCESNTALGSLSAPIGAEHEA